MPNEARDPVDPDLVIPEQSAISVYRNGNGHLVIRATATKMDVKDQIVVLTNTGAIRSLVGVLMAAAHGDL